MPVYNGEKYLHEAIDSILNQTFLDFEFLIINDGSTDNSALIIKEYSDPRIIYYEQVNQGLAGTLNHGIGLSKGEYLARQDQDDISLPDRLEKQVDFLEAHPACGMVGTWAEILEIDKRAMRYHKHPHDNIILKFELLFDNPFVHSSVMIRKEVFQTIGIYSTDKSRQPPEDYEFWSRIARKYEVANIPEILQIYREVPRSMSRTGQNPFLDQVINRSIENLALITGRPISDKNLTDLASLAHAAYHRVSPRPNLKEISCILNQAATILDNPESPRLQKTVESRIEAIRGHFFISRKNKIEGKILTLLKKLLKRRKCK